MRCICGVWIVFVLLLGTLSPLCAGCASRTREAEADAAPLALWERMEDGGGFRHEEFSLPGNHNAVLGSMKVYGDTLYLLSNTDDTLYRRNEAGGWEIVLDNLSEMFLPLQQEHLADTIALFTAYPDIDASAIRWRFYLLGFAVDGQNRIFFLYRETGDQYAYAHRLLVVEEEIKILSLPAFTDMPTRLFNGVSVYVDRPDKLEVAPCGDILLRDTGRAILRYGADGAPIASYTMNDCQDFALIGDMLYAYAPSMEIRRMDLATDAELEAVPLERGGRLRLSKDGLALYVAADNGVDAWDQERQRWIRLASGGTASPGAQDVDVDRLCVDGEGQGFFLMTGGESVMSRESVSRYVYDPEMIISEKETLHIYAYRSSETLSHAMAVFGRSQPDYNIEYESAGAMQLTRNDVVRILNTRILAGAAPDILLLDGLPIDSYIGKGVLMDLSLWLAPMQEDGTLLSNIIGAFETDGKIEAIPSKFAIPTLWGGGDADMQSLQTLEDLASAAAQGYDETPPFAYMRPEQLIQQFYYSCAPPGRTRRAA